MLGDRMPEPAQGHLPFGLGVVDMVGEGERAADAVIDAGAAGQQSFR